MTAIQHHRPLYKRLRPRYWQSRLWLVVMVAQALVIMTTAEGSLSYRAVEASGKTGWYWVSLLAGVAIWAAVDLLVNDLLPAGYEWPGEQRRYLVYIAMAMGLVSICGAIVIAVGWTTLLLFYGSLAAWSMQIAVTDLMHYHQMRAAADRAPELEFDR